MKERKKRYCLAVLRLIEILVEATVQGAKNITLDWHRNRFVVLFDQKVVEYAFHQCTPQDLRVVQRYLVRKGQGHMLSRCGKEWIVRLPSHKV